MFANKESLLDTLYSDDIDGYGNVPMFGALDFSAFDLQNEIEGAGTPSMADGIQWSDYCSSQFNGPLDGADLYEELGATANVSIQPSADTFDYSSFVNGFDEHEEGQNEISLVDLLETPPPSDYLAVQHEDSVFATFEFPGQTGVELNVSLPMAPAAIPISVQDNTHMQPSYSQPSFAATEFTLHHPQPVHAAAPLYPLITDFNFFSQTTPQHAPPDAPFISYPFPHFQTIPSQPLPYPVHFMPPPALAYNTANVQPSGQKRSSSSPTGSHSSRRKDPYARRDLQGHADIPCEWNGCSEVLRADGRTWRRHIKEHTLQDTTGERRIRCRWRHCKSGLIEKGCMYRHALGIHTKLLNQRCPHCEYSGRGDMMDRHIEKKHKDIKKTK